MEYTETPDPKSRERPKGSRDAKPRIKRIPIEKESLVSEVSKVEAPLSTTPMPAKKEKGRSEGAYRRRSARTGRKKGRQPEHRAAASSLP